MVEGSTTDGEQQITGQSGHNYKLVEMVIVRVVGILGLILLDSVVCCNQITKGGNRRLKGSH